VTNLKSGHFDGRPVPARWVFTSIDRRVAFGSAIVALGVLLTVLSYGTRGAWGIQRLWPLLVVGLGFVRIADQSSRIAGWVLMIAGGGVLLSNLGLFTLPECEVVRYWPLTVVIVGLLEVVRSRSIGGKGEGVGALFLGVWLQLSYFGAPHISSYHPWPLALAAVGGLAAWRGLKAPQKLFYVG